MKKEIYLKTLLLLALMLIGSLAANADSFEIDGIRYETNGYNEATVISADDTWSITIPEIVEFEGSVYTVTAIGDNSFYNCRVQRISIPNTVESIGEQAFMECQSLHEIFIPMSVRTIGEGAFSWCRSLQYIYVDINNNNYDSREYCNAIIETSSNTLIAGCMNTVIPNSVISIANDAFSGRNGLNEITIPNSVTSIGDYAFAWCEGLTSITIPNSVTSIGSSAFRGCSSLSSITIPSSVTSLGEDVFSGTAWYSNQPDGLIYIGQVAYVYKGTMPAGTNIIIDNGTLGIAGGAFRQCSGLTNVAIPNSVTSIGDGAFYNCI